MKSSDLFIVDNTDENWQAHNYLSQWCDLSNAFDIATGYFEIGSLLKLDGQWQKLKKIRILMGDEVSHRTEAALLEALKEKLNKLDESVETEKEDNDFLTGVDNIVEAIRSGQIECRVYKKKKFHAKMYITHSSKDVIGSMALVGSSNFTIPGMTQNIEMNVQIKTDVSLLQKWFEKHWQEGEEITEGILKTIERHIAEHLPFIVYAKSLSEYFRGKEANITDWETKGEINGGSKMYPILDKYQKEGYQALLKISEKWNGAFLCDGVGLGKTYIGLMLIERFLYERKKILLLSPKSTTDSVWKPEIKRFLPHSSGEFSNLAVYNHTDLLVEGDVYDNLESVKEQADVVIIDEAHHFRTLKKKGRYSRLYDIIGNKPTFMLTATPINNSIQDFRNMIYLFSRKNDRYFAEPPLGIPSVEGQFKKLNTKLNDIIDEPEKRDLEGEIEAKRTLEADPLFKELIVQRSRKYVRESQRLAKGSRTVTFPKPQLPKVQEYNLTDIYGPLLKKFITIFDKKNPLLNLSMYNPYEHFLGEEESTVSFNFELGRKKQVIALVRTSLLKRFESSYYSFQESCHRLLLKMDMWCEINAETESEKNSLKRVRDKNKSYLNKQFEEDEDDDGDALREDIDFGNLEEMDRAEFNVNEIVKETVADMKVLIALLKEMKDLTPENDEKANKLVQLLKTSDLKDKKVILFTEFKTTAKHLYGILKNTNFENIEMIDGSTTGKKRLKIIKRFAPYYNHTSVKELSEPEINILVSTDVLSEGLNLQDATRLINYDIHWNPVRLMQRIGRIDRRLNNETEGRIKKNHPERAGDRGEVGIWNFLPPNELDDLLHLYSKVSNKVLHISKTLGLETSPMDPNAEIESIREFNAGSYTLGKTNAVEDLRLEYHKLLSLNPGLEDKINGLPWKVFTGKKSNDGAMRGIFCCYAIPGPPNIRDREEGRNLKWTLENGESYWYLYNLENESILESAEEIANFIRSEPNTARITEMDKEMLVSTRKKIIEKHINNSQMRQIQAPMGVRPRLVCWMEIN